MLHPRHGDVERFNYEHDHRDDYLDADYFITQRARRYLTRLLKARARRVSL